MYGFYTEYSYVGFMPDGSKREFVSYEDYEEAFQSSINSE